MPPFLYLVGNIHYDNYTAVVNELQEQAQNPRSRFSSSAYKLV